MFGFRNKKNTHKNFGGGDRVFLDYASTTPLLPEVLYEMKKYFSENFENSSALYKEGMENKKVLESSRERVAQILKVRKGDIYFTGSGTEADNLALLGVFEAYKESVEAPHFIISKIEHPAISETAKEIEKRGGEVTYLGVDEDGLVDLAELESAIKENTVLVSVIYASNEVGTVEPVGKASRIVRKWKETQGRSATEYPFVHTDASQAPVYLDCNCERLGVDLMTLDGSKIYGPKGIGVLYKKHCVSVKPVIFGGGQEKGLRSATVNLPAIVGFTKAFDIAQENFESVAEKVSQLRDYFIKKVLEEISGATLNGSAKYRIANNVSICFEDFNAEFAVIQLDEKGIACAYTTACKTSGDESESYVVSALGKKDCAGSSLRFTLDQTTTRADIDLTIKYLSDIV